MAYLIGIPRVINIFHVRFQGEGGGSQKAYVLYTCENVDNYGRPLTSLELVKDRVMKLH